MTTSTPQTRFEEDLKTYFPDIHTFWQLTKEDRRYADLLDAMLYMVHNNKFGIIEIHYQQGSLGHIFKKEKI